MFCVCSDLGAHIDGFIAVAAHTVVARADTKTKVSGRKADAILAAYWAGQAALRLLKPGNGVSKLKKKSYKRNLKKYFMMKTARVEGFRS